MTTHAVRCLRTSSTAHRCRFHHHCRRRHRRRHLRHCHLLRYRHWPTTRGSVPSAAGHHLSSPLMPVPPSLALAWPSLYRCDHRQPSNSSSTRLEMEHGIHSNALPVPALSPVLDRPSRAQSLPWLRGSSRAPSDAPLWTGSRSLGSVEDAARGRRPAACMPLLHALMHAPHRAVTLSL